MTDRTCVVVASAYSYPHGIMDPVEELAALAQEHGAACHVDACIGGFVLPFMEMLGETYHRGIFASKGLPRSRWMSISTATSPRVRR